jgi:hypothetical protein
LATSEILSSIELMFNGSRKVTIFGPVIILTPLSKITCKISSAYEEELDIAQF